MKVRDSIDRLEFQFEFSIYWIGNREILQNSQQGTSLFY